MSKQNLNVEDLIEQMACMKLINDSDFKKADKPQKELMKVNCKGEIKKQVDQLSEEISRYIPSGINLLTSVEFAVASQMISQIEKNPELPINQINVDNRNVFEALNLIVEYDEDKGEINSVVAASALGYALDDDNKQNEINNIPPEISQERDGKFTGLSSRVHEDGASDEEKSTMIGLSYGSLLDTGVEIGLKFSDLGISDQCEIIKIINDHLRDGEQETADFYCKAYGITKSDLENPEYKNGIEHFMDTISSDEDEVMYKINDLSSQIRMFLDYSDQCSPEVCEAYWERIMQNIETHEYPVDAIFKALDSCNGRSQNKELYSRVISLGIEKGNDPNVNVNMDGWLLSYMIGTVKNKDNFGEIEDIGQIVKLINKGLGSNGINLTIDDVLNIDILSLQEYISNESKRTQSASECMKGYAEEKGLDYSEDRTITLGTMSDIVKNTNREPNIPDKELLEDFKIGLARAYKDGGDTAAVQCYEDFRDRYSPFVQKSIEKFIQDGGYRALEVKQPKKVDIKEKKRQSLEKMMNTVVNGKGLVKAQEMIEDLIIRYPDKEIAIGAALNFLESQKDSNVQFIDEDSRDAREGIFEAIVLTGIEEPKFYEKMQELDRETSKLVVNKILGQINDSRTSINKVLGAVQMLGKNLNQKTEPVVEDKPLGFLKVENANLPHVDMFGKDKNDEGFEPDDR